MTSTHILQGKIAILGAGAIGQSLCHQLHELGQTPILINRGGLGQYYQQQLTLIEGNHQHKIISPLVSSQQLLNKQVAFNDLKLLIVTVKAYQVVEALEPLLHCLPKQCHILLMHNGMGPHEQIKRQITHQGLSLGTTSQGALLTESWQVQKTGSGITQIGHFYGPSMDTAMQQCLMGLADCQWCDAILPCLWQKLAVNVAINPLTAINQCPNGALAAPQYQTTIAHLTEEVVTVANAAGIKLNLNQLLDRIYNVIALTATNRSSMHQDIYHQRMTEIEAINGYVSAKGKVYGIATPTNDEMLAQITALQSS
ncbi:ketopantoate reductase family protein [Shewanella waksmanii]|uniref:ketopantoate reductase family protein n=1 Tax=Shewanella waksmanii TaxID=213783 RepID=UPI0037369134